MTKRCLLALMACCVIGAPAIAEDEVIINGHTFASWTAYVQSDYFRENGMRCQTPEPTFTADDLRVPADCSSSFTDPLPVYDPSQGLYTIPVVVHVISNTSGTGNLSDAQVMSQIDILNEDFLAIAGTNGENGTDSQIQFCLVGIERYTNNTWFGDNGNYWSGNEYDPDEHLNIYTNQAGGALGYVPGFPWSIAGASGDRVVCLYSAFGRNAPLVPYHQGRTATHEVGHYFGLYHTFQSGCGTASAPGCYSTGDRICDTNSDQTSHFGCPNTNTCGTPDPITNYMEYTDDLCMEDFTPEQSRRMRCALESYRANLPIDPNDCGIVAIGEPTATDGRVFFALQQNRPNPFNPSTSISFDMMKSGYVNLQVMDVSGRVIKTLSEGKVAAGPHNLTWDGTNNDKLDVAPGVYFYRLETNEGSQTRRMVLVK